MHCDENPVEFHLIRIEDEFRLRVVFMFGVGLALGHCYGDRRRRVNNYHLSLPLRLSFTCLLS